MEKWQGKVAVVTGASKGIGASVALALANSGMIVVGLARQSELIEDLSSKATSGKIYARRCDVTNESDILESFAWIKSELGGVDVLINNAGIMRTAFLIEGTTEDFKDSLNTNVLASCVCIREAVKDMRERNAKGHIIVMNSILGHRIPDLPVPLFSAYPATKFALNAICQTVKQELDFHKCAIKLTSISPGLVDTEFILSFITKSYDFVPKLSPDDVTSAILFALGTPQNVQIDELIMTAKSSFD